MLRSVLIVASALVLLAVGAMTAAAGNRHANSAAQLAGATKAGAITTLTSGAMLEVKAQDDEEKAQEAAQQAAQAQSQAQVAQASDDEQDVNDEQENDNEGDGSD
jgi:hypothetical protein